MPADRSMINPSATAKLSHVGPGSYNSADDAWASAQGRGAPFLSLSERTTTSASSRGAPGPGQYDIRARPLRSDKVDLVGSADFRSGAPKIGPMTPGATVFSEATIIKNPGPGRYDTMV